MKTQELSNAVFSDDKKHRWVLWRMWDENKPKLMLIGLNPSTANETTNDNTIKKVVKIARYNGYGGIYMLNLFTHITPYPEELPVKADDWEMAKRLLNTYAKESKTILFCWGNFKVAKERAKLVMAMFPDAHCLHQNKNGSPKHPLYCQDKSLLKPFNAQI